MPHILAFDQGTTSSRAILFDRDVRIRAVAQQEFEQHFPRPGWVEHDPEEIWESQLKVARDVLKEAGVEASDVEAIGITNQRETAILWDRETGESVAPAIVWQDRRTSGFCDRLTKEGHAQRIQEKTGLVIDAYFSGTKVRWLLENVKGLRERAEAGEIAFGTVDSWLLWKLTGGEVHATDVSNAGRTMLFNIHELDWDKELLELLDIPAAVLPEVRGNSEVYGTAGKDLLGAEIPVAGMAGDQHAALFGQACHESGQAKNTYGTGSFLLMNTGSEPVKSENRLLTTMGWKIGNEVTYALEGSIFVTGATVQWLRDQLGIIREAAEIESLAREVEDNGGVYLVPAFAGLGAPHWDQHARGAIVGLTRGSSKAHLARAALESIALQSLDVLEAMQKDSGIELTELRADGGASMNALLMEFQADLLGVPVIRPEIHETTALGAAFFAGLAVGFWPDLPTVADKWREDTRFEPRPLPERDKLVKTWRKAIERARDWEEE